MISNNIAIVGAGITGLTAGWKLQKSGFEVTLFERRDFPGGSIRTEKTNGWLVEYGPNTLRLKSKRLLDLFGDIGLKVRMVEANPKADKRFVVKNGVLQPVPSGVGKFLKTPLFSMKGKLELLKEPFVRRGSDPGETLASFVNRRLGQEALDYAVNPFVAGVYAGSPESLSVRHAFPGLYRLEQENGSLIAGAIKKAMNNKESDSIKSRLISFKGGLQELPYTLAEGIGKIHYSTEVDRIQLGPDGWEVQAAGDRYGLFDQLILNIPLYRYSERFIRGGGDVLEALQYVKYPPLSVAVTGFGAMQVKHQLDGFGFLVPAAEKRKILGSLFNSTLFPARAPEGKVLITTFVGGSRQPELANLDSGEMKTLVCSELEDLLGVKGDPEFFEHIFWPQSIPQYTIQYEKLLRTIESLEINNPGLKIGGNFRGGIALPDCMANGIYIAEHIESYKQNQ